LWSQGADEGAATGGGRSGLGRVTWHQFRHIHSSLLNDLNVPSKIAQEQLGHASISTTLGIYTHAIAASHREAIAAVEERLFAQLLSNVLESENALASARPARAVLISFGIGGAARI
jgi:Phage integrase family